MVAFRQNATVFVPDVIAFGLNAIAFALNVIASGVNVITFALNAIAFVLNVIAFRRSAILFGANVTEISCKTISFCVIATGNLLKTGVIALNVIVFRLETTAYFFGSSLLILRLTELRRRAASLATGVFLPKRPIAASSLVEDVS